MKQLQNLQSVEDLEALSPETFFLLGTLLYPKIVKDLISKVAQKQLKQVLKKDHFFGYQCKTWH